MKMLVALLFSGLVYASGENPDCENVPNPADQSVIELARAFTRTCPEVSYQPAVFDGTISVKSQTQPIMVYNIGRGTRTPPEKICECLKQNKFSELKVPDEAKRSFNEQKVNSAIGKNIKFAMNDLFGNITRYKNFNLPSDLHEKAKGMCNPQKVMKSIVDLKSKAGTPGCGSSVENFESRLKDILGDVDPMEYSRQYQAYNLGVDDKSCISRQKFLHLRSSTYNSGNIGLSVTTSTELEDFFLKENLGSNSSEFLKYDIFFSQGLRDSDFKSEMAALIRKNYPPSMIRVDLSKLLPNDPEALAIIHKSLEDTCKSVSEQVQTFLCSEKVPKLHSRNISLVLNDSMSADSDASMDQSVREFFVKRYACMESEENTRENDNPFNKFFEGSANLKKALIDPVSEKPDSDYSKFNKMFCKGREGTPIKASDLPTLMNEFFAEKLKSGLDLKALFSDPALAPSLNFVIDPSANPPIKGKSKFELPEINRTAFDIATRGLLAQGMTTEELIQLYTILEMQTNFRKAQIRSVHDSMLRRDPKLALLSLTDVDGLLRGDPTITANLNKQYGTQTVQLASSIYEVQEQNRSERFGQIPNSIAPALGTGVALGASVADNLKTTPERTTKSDIIDAPVPQKSSSPSASSISSVAPSISSSSSFSPSSSRSSSSSDSSSSQTSDQTSLSRSSDSSSSSDYSRSTTSTSSPELGDDIKRMREEVEKNRQRLEEAGRTLNRKTTATLNQPKPSIRPGPKFIAQRPEIAPDYEFPRNLPVKNQNGDYYRPETKGSELSSASGSGGGRASSEGPSGSSSSSVGGGASFGSGSVSGRASGRNPASGDMMLSVLKDVAPFEHNRYIPQSIFDVVGSIDKVIMLLGLEGKAFRTIEAIEEPDKATGKIKIRYFERKFDFVPEGKFQKFKDLFATKETRTEAFRQYFSFPRTKENVPLSKQYSLATRQLSKEEVPHSYVLNIQNYILSDAEIQDTMNRTMELFK